VGRRGAKRVARAISEADEPSQRVATENRATRAGTCGTTRDSMLRAAASEARVSGGAAERREGGGVGDGSRAYIGLARCPRKLCVTHCTACVLRF
jgi:hypothetical protein